MWKLKNFFYITCGSLSYKNMYNFAVTSAKIIKNTIIIKKYLFIYVMS